MSGINIIILYGGGILNSAVAGQGRLMQIFAIVIQLLGCLLVASASSRLGRKALIQIGVLFSIAVLLTFGISFLPYF
jgi:hypothetical protein